MCNSNVLNSLVVTCFTWFFTTTRSSQWASVLALQGRRWWLKRPWNSGWLEVRPCFCGLKRLKIDDERLPDIFIYYMMLVCRTTEVLMSDCFFWLFRWFWKKQYRLQAMNWNFQLGSNKKTLSSSRGKSDSRESPDYLGFQLGHCCWRICCFLTLILTSVSFLLIRDAVLLSRIDGRTPGASEDWLVKCSKKRCGGHMPNIDVIVLKHPLPLSSCFWKKNPNSAKFFHSTLHSEPFETTTPPVLPPFNHDFYSTCAIFWWVSSQFFHGKWLKKLQLLQVKFPKDLFAGRCSALIEAACRYPGRGCGDGNGRAEKTKKPTEKLRLN